MASISLRGIKKSYASGPQIVKGLSLEITNGEFMVFVGPSGCGKSTLLRMIAGLEDISEGELRIGDQVVNHVSPAERGVAMVFQSYALYPHMTVRENMGFALKIAGKPEAVVRQAVNDVAEILRITHMLERKPKELSGGERQRVAIGRSIVRQPKVFLFDEPLSNLDAALRVQMRIELAKLHEELGTTMIYVTHDQVEAMTLGDRVAVFNGGRLEQVAAPLELYRNPASQFVAGFIGAVKMNFLPADVLGNDDRSLTLNLGGNAQITLPSGQRLRLDQHQQITVGIRPEHLHIVDPERDPQAMKARIILLEQLGDTQIVHANLLAPGPRQESGQSHTIAIKQHGDNALPYGHGDLIGLQPDQRHIRLFDRDGRALKHD